MSVGIRITDKPRLATIDEIFGMKNQGSKAIGPMLVADFEEQLLAGIIGDVINAIGTNGGRVYTNKATMDADLSPAAKSSAWVIGDPIAANNGIYQKQGISGSGSWARVADLPYSFIAASDVGAGTANAIQATTFIPVSSSALIWMNIFETNGLGPTTVQFNGIGPVYTIKTNSGNDPSAGGLAGGMIVLGILSGSTLRLVSDQASTAVVAAAEAAQAAAENARDVAVAAAATTDPLATHTFSVVLAQTSVTISGGYTVGKVATVHLNGVEIDGWAASTGTTVTFPAITANDIADGESSATLKVRIGTPVLGLDALDNRYMMHGILSNGSDLNSITKPGIYTVTAPINGAYSGYSGAWQVEIGVVGNVGVQRMWPRINPAFVWARDIEDTWSAWTPMGGQVSPEHYGATGVYSLLVDDSDAIYAALNSGFRVTPVGTYNLAAKIECGAGFGGKDVHMVGGGKNHFLVTSVDGGITFHTGIVTVQSSLRCVFRDFNMVCSVAGHTGIALEVRGVSGQGSGTTPKNFDISNLQFFANLDSNGFSKGVSVFNGRNGTVRGCSYQGVRNQTPGSRAGVGFEAYGDADPVDVTFDDNEAYFCLYAFSITGTMEGARIINNTGVGCDRGLNVQLDENPIVGPNTGKQLIMVFGNHFNCFHYGMYISRVWDVLVDNNSMLFEQANGNGQGIYVRQEGEIPCKARLSNNSIFDRTTGSPSTGTTIGINLEATNPALLNMEVDIYGTNFNSMKFCIFSQGSSADIRYSIGSTRFTNSTANLGGNVAGITGY